MLKSNLEKINKLFKKKKKGNNSGETKSDIFIKLNFFTRFSKYSILVKFTKIPEKNRI